MSGLYTIGCSIHTNESFFALLQKHNISAIADVRSDPYSKHTPQFNEDSLGSILRKNGIYYLPFGIEFGARRKEPEVYINGKVVFV